jgi:hypothetical protein
LAYRTIRALRSGFLRQDKVLNHAFFHHTPAKVPDALTDIVTPGHVIRVERRVAALGTGKQLLCELDACIAEIDLLADPQTTLL